MQWSKFYLFKSLEFNEHFGLSFTKQSYWMLNDGYTQKYNPHDSQECREAKSLQSGLRDI